MRKKILAANWKMNLTHTEAEAYFETFLSEIGQVNDIEIVIIPAFTAIPALVSASEKVPAVRIGAQNMHWEKSGAFTGEVSAAMLRALYVKYVIVGHSERRSLFGETDEIVNRKVRAALDAGCVRFFAWVKHSTKERTGRSRKSCGDRRVRDWKASVKRICPKSSWPMNRVGPLGPVYPRRRQRPKRHTHLSVQFLPSFLERRLLTGFVFNMVAV
jgi:triosephosphate isomerase (TIM)